MLKLRIDEVTMPDSAGADDVFGRRMQRIFNSPIADALIPLALAVVQSTPLIWRRIPAIYSYMLDETPPRQDFAAATLVGISPDPQHEGVERWSIGSPSMRRVVEVQVVRPRDSDSPAPTLVLLDGVSAPKESGWLREGQLSQFLATTNATVVMPTQAPGSLYEDWVHDDPVVGRHQWESFISKELLPIIEDPLNGIKANGHHIIGGLSMGAAGAVRIAARHPDIFHGVIGLSGCYSTSGVLGRGMVLAIVRCVGAEPDNIWGHGMTKRRLAADIADHPHGLGALPVYLFTANGRITDEDIRLHRGHPRYELPGAVVLEKAAYRSTRILIKRMRELGLPQPETDIEHSGVHAWAYYGPQLCKGWNSVYSRVSDKEPASS
ncbi:alpha/beta hydrolase-fold protein [Corynebacterium sp. ES2715-CONJ3]|nr:alpha/beta hydrolase-fold protein [Corynebacterium sp. ES2715-CONJ3]